MVWTNFQTAHNSSVREFTGQIEADLTRKLVLLTGARQAGKTTLARQLMAGFEPAQYLNWDVPADRQLIVQHAWSPKARLVVFDEIHKMRDWKAFLKGAWDGRSDGQAMLVTGSARMDTFRQGGESLAGRYFNWRLHPLLRPRTDGDRRADGQRRAGAAVGPRRLSRTVPRRQRRRRRQTQWPPCC
jgi:hypothetical protein